jgi:hypothetical protein
MIVEDVIENEDGSATLKLELTKEEAQIFIGVGIRHILWQAVEDNPVPQDIFVETELMELPLEDHP